MKRNIILFTAIFLSLTLVTGCEQKCKTPENASTEEIITAFNELFEEMELKPDKVHIVDAKFFGSPRGALLCFDDMQLTRLEIEADPQYARERARHEYALFTVGFSSESNEVKVTDSESYYASIDEKDRSRAVNAISVSEFFDLLVQMDFEGVFREYGYPYYQIQTTGKYLKISSFKNNEPGIYVYDRGTNAIKKSNDETIDLEKSWLPLYVYGGIKGKGASGNSDIEVLADFDIRCIILIPKD